MFELDPVLAADTLVVGDLFLMRTNCSQDQLAVIILLKNMEISVPPW